MKNVKLVLKSIVSELFDRANRSIETTYSEPGVYISRRKAMMFADSGNVDHMGTSTVFGQIVTNLDLMYAEEPEKEMKNFCKRKVDKKCFKVHFLGEGGEDAGGLFRDCLVDIAAELMSPVLPLL